MGRRERTAHRYDLVPPRSRSMMIEAAQGMQVECEARRDEVIGKL